MSAADGESDPSELTEAQAAAMLLDARDKARLLVERLERDRAEVDRHPPALSPEALAQGREAMERAVAAARRTLQAIEAAIAAAPGQDHSQN